jgi:hypothetical protein
MSVAHSLSAEELASLFHYYRELLATDFGLQSSEGCCSWEEVLPRHRQLMLATARLVLRDLAARQQGTVPLD